MKMLRREQAQKHLIQTQEELVQAAKMAVVGQAMTSLARTNQSATFAINISVQYQTDYLDGKHDQLRILSNVLKNCAARMNRIITALRNFSRKSSSQN